MKRILRVMREKAQLLKGYPLTIVKSGEINKQGWLNFLADSYFESFFSISGLSQTSIVRDIRGRRPVSKQRFLINRNGT